MGIHFVFWYFRFNEVLRVSQTLTLSLFLSVWWTTFSGPERNMLTTGVRWMGRISRVVLCWQPRILEHSLSSTSCFSLGVFFFFSEGVLPGVWCWYCFCVDAIFNMSWGELNQRGSSGVGQWWWVALDQSLKSHLNHLNHPKPIQVTTVDPLKWRNLCELNLPLTSHFPLFFRPSFVFVDLFN